MKDWLIPTLYGIACGTAFLAIVSIVQLAILKSKFNTLVEKHNALAQSYFESKWYANKKRDNE